MTTQSTTIRPTVTRADFNRLSEILQSQLCRMGHGAVAINLELNLNRSEIVSQKRISPRVVTMNSTVSLRDMDDNDLDIYTLVYPKDANIDQDKLSVLSYLGSQLLGASVGEVITVGIRRIMVEDILYQPEAAGDYHL